MCCIAFSQQSDYVKSFEWMVKTVEENDAGFKYVIDFKGKDDYERFTSTCRDKILKAGSKKESVAIMNSWLSYFRAGHIGVFQKTEDGLQHKYPPVVLTESEKDSIRKVYKNEETVKITMQKFEQYLGRKQGKIHKIEGVWKNSNYTIGIMRSAGEGNKFEAFIIKADSIYWMPGQKKAELTLNGDSGFDVSYSMNNHQKERTSVKWLSDSYNIMSLMNSKWIKIYPKPDFSKKDSLIFALDARQPYFISLNDQTNYLRIPSFGLEQKSLIDSILLKHDKLIKSAKNLIIDIRWGTGGSDNSWSNIIPYAYTNPIRWIGMRFRATELNAQCYEKYANINKSDTAGSNYCLRKAKELRGNIGGYTEGSGVEIDSAYHKFDYPVRIAVISNKHNASADEAFLYTMRQSLKVKIFGRPTGGSFDVSNVNEIAFTTDSTLFLWYAMSIRKSLPDYIVDGVGIQPDYFIDDSIKEEDWVDFVRGVIEK